MQYFVSFLEGFITFISPCMLPMLPVYLSYFAGGKVSEKKHVALRNSIAFVLGFSVVFILLGALSGSLGAFIFKNSRLFNIIGGLIIIIFGLNYMGIFKIGFLNKVFKIQSVNSKLGFFPSILFGIIFSIGWSPCVGTFLGSALMLAANQGTALKGTLLLSAYSLGLGIPFILSAVLIERLKGAFDFIKRHYRIINLISGLLLVVVGVLMITGYLGIFLGLLSI